ncbi:RpiB/LacA/LacB family sugar-phosphate isomerase, partial [Staphylococcus aureus]
MAIIIGSDEAGKRLKEVIKSYLLDNKYDVVDVTEGQEVDFVDATLAVA